jgi:RNA polymerase sigma-70 factor (ECF subfamily)
MDTDARTDDELVAACIQGDRQCFPRLVRNHERLLRTVAYSITGDKTAMEDAMQEGLFKAHKSLGSYHPGSDFRSWLCKIVRNAALDEVRKRKRRPVSLLTQDVASTDAIDETVSRRLDIEAAVFRLPEKQRSALLLVDTLGFDYATAAAMLDVPAGTVASRVNTARASLRTTLTSVNKDDER